MVTPGLLKKRLAGGLTYDEATSFDRKPLFFELIEKAKDHGLDVYVVQFRVVMMRLSLEEALLYGHKKHPPLNEVIDKLRGVDTKKLQEESACLRKKNLEKSRSLHVSPSRFKL